MHWKGLYFSDQVLPFGLRSAPYIFNQLSDALEWIAKNNYDLTHILNILDDFFVIEPPPRANCMTSYDQYKCSYRTQKTFPASTELELSYKTQFVLP
jgi:hypothetical protein